MTREKRLYAFVPYQLTGIQKGIQMQHALTEYDDAFGTNEDYIDWRQNWKTTIVLDGGTTNEGITECKYNGALEKGTMQQFMDLLIENNVKVEGFWEPDLNNTLTAFVFIADEPVFNHKDFPFFEQWLDICLHNMEDTYMEYLKYFKNAIPRTLDDYKKDWKKFYNRWEDEVGGRKNAFLKYFLVNKRLASN